MVEKLEVSVEIDLSKLDAGLQKTEDRIKQSGERMEKNLQIRASIDSQAIDKSLDNLDQKVVDSQNKRVSATKRANDAMVKDTQEAEQKKAQAVDVYIDGSIEDINRLKQVTIENARITENAFELSPEKTQKQLKQREEGIRKVGLVAKNTGKEIDKATTERFISLGIREAELTKQLNSITSKLNTAFKARKIDLDVETTRIKSQLAEIEKAKQKITEKDKLIKLDIQTKVLQNKLEDLAVRKRALTKQADLKLNLDTKRIRSELTSVNSEMRRIENTGKSVTKGLGAHFNTLSDSIRAGLFSTFGALSVGGALARGIRSLGQLLQDSISVAKNWESAFTGVEKTTEATAKQFEALREELIELTKEIPLTFEEISKIAELGGQMGVPVQYINEFTEAIAKIASTTNLSIEQAATQFARLSNILQIPLTDIDRLASAVVSLGNNFAAQEDEILNFTTRIAGSGQVVGLLGPELAAIGTAFTSVGLQAELGGSAVNRALLKINDSVIDGGEALEGFATVAGKSAEEFKEEWETDAAGAFTAFVEGLGQSGDNANKILNDLLGNNVRIKQAFLSIANAGDLLARSIENANTAYRENVALSEEAALRYGTEESKLAILTNRYQEQQQILGKELLPSYVRLKEIQVQLINGFTRLGNAVGGLKNLLIGLSGVLGTVITVLTAIFIGPVGIAIIGVLSAIGGVMLILGKNVNAAKTKLEKLDQTLGKLSKQANKNKDDQEDLIQSFLSGNLTLEEYRSKLNTLIKEEADLNKQIGETVTEREKLEKANQEILKTQEQYEAQLLKEIDLEKKVSKQKDVLANAESELIKQKKDTTLTDEEQTKALEDLEGKVTEAKEALEEYQNQLLLTKAKTEEVNEFQGKTVTLRKILTKGTKDQTEQEELYAQFVLNKAGTKTELDALIEKYNGVAAAARQATLEELAQARQSLKDLKDAQKIIDEGGLVATLKEGFKAIGDKDYQTVKFRIDETEKNIGKLMDTLSEIDNYKFEPIIVPSTINEANKLAEEVNGVLGKIAEGSKEITKQMKEINDLLLSGNITANDRERLNARALELSEELTKLKEAETKAIGDGNDKASVKNAILEAELEIAKTNYIAKLQFVNDSYTNEIKKAKRLVEIKEEYEEEKRRLEGETYKNIIENAEAVIKKQEELQKEGQKAFTKVTESVEDTAKEIGKLTDEIDKINEEIVDIETEAIEDLQDRYGEISGEISDIDEKIKDTEASIKDADGSTEDLEESWKNVSDEIKDSQKSIDDYSSSIKKINEEIEDLDKSSTEKLADTYVKLGQEIAENSERLDELNAKAILSTEEEEEKLKIQQEINKAIEDQAKARAEVSDADIERATLISEESDVEKIIRERDERNLVHQQELKDLQKKLDDEKVILETKKKEEQTLRIQLDAIEEEEQKAKLNQLQANLEQYYEDREKLIKEQADLEKLLTTEQQQEAIDLELETKTEGIIKSRDLEIKAKQEELDILKKSNQEKLDEIRKYYVELFKLNKLGQAQFGESFKLEDFATEEVKEGLKGVDTGGLSLDISKDIQDEIASQQEATQKIDKLADILDNFIKQSKGDRENLLNFLNIVTGLRAQANVSPIYQPGTTTQVTQSNVFQVSSGIDIASLEAMLRRSVKI